MILKIFQKCFWESGILVYCQFDSLFMFTAKGKLVWALKIAWQLAMWGLVAYKLVLYKKTKCSKSIPGFSISRLANVEDFFNVNIFFKCKYVRINDYSFKYVCIVCCLKIRFYCLTFSAMSNLNSADFTTPNSHQRFWFLK